MRILNGWPLVLLILFFGVALLPMVIMVGLELGGLRWAGPRTGLILGFAGYFLLGFPLLQPLSEGMTRYGYIFKSASRQERFAGLKYTATYFIAVHFLPSVIFFCVGDILFPWDNSVISWNGVTTTAGLIAMFMLPFLLMLGSDFRTGYRQARDDMRNGVPLQI